MPACACVTVGGRSAGGWLAQVPAPSPSLPGGYDLNYVLFNLTGPEAARQTKVCVLSDRCA